MNELAVVARDRKTRLGDFVGIHQIGEYALVEYHPTIFENYCSTGKTDKSKSEYACYINGNDIGYSRPDMDFALAICIAYKHEGCNPHAAGYFMRMIDANKPQSPQLVLQPKDSRAEEGMINAD